MPPVRPMLAKSVSGVPDPDKHGGLLFEPKWDGFRCLVFKDGDEVELTSRNTKPLTRYFPEVVAAMREQLPARCVLDGELFVARRADGGVDRLEFEVLQERIHPAASRVDLLAEQTPAGYVAFDLLALGDESYVARPFRERRAALERALDGLTGPVHLTRTTTDPVEAEAVVRRVRGSRARRRGRQAAGRGVRAERPHDAQDQARAHRRRGARRLPRAQDVHARSVRWSAACCSACTPAASCSTSASAPASPRSAAPSWSSELQPPGLPHRGAPVGGLGGRGRVGDRQPRPGARHPEPLERRARTCRSRRCARSGCWR